MAPRRLALGLVLGFALARCGGETGGADAASPADRPSMDASGGEGDAGASEAGRDAIVTDAEIEDQALAETGPSEDAEPIDAGEADAGVCVPTSTSGVDTSSTPPPLLSMTGLYTDTASKTLRAGNEAFQPRYALWSDGAVKSRWVHLPECTSIGTGDMDHWELPVGTKLWKEFVVDGRRIETRMIHRFGPGPDDFTFSAYQWDAQETEGLRVPLGVTNAGGTGHDIPSQAHCRTCHTHLSERALGFSAIQLSHDGPGLRITDLSTRGQLSTPALAGFQIPGSSTVAEALGYLHANCGNCHNDSADAIPFVQPFSLRVSVTSTSPESTATYRTAVDVPVERFVFPGVTHRVRPGLPDASGVYVRMSTRMSVAQMPPLATERVDPVGRDLVRAWVDDL